MSQKGRFWSFPHTTRLPDQVAKKRRTFRKYGFQRENRLNISDEKKNISSLDQTTP